jgi:HEAT repeat protein
MHAGLRRDPDQAQREYVAMLRRQMDREAARVRERIASALLAIGGPEAMDALETMLADERREFADAARAAFRQAGDARRGELHALLADRTRPTRLRLQALGLLQSIDAAPPVPEARGWDAGALREALDGTAGESEKAPAIDPRLADTLAALLDDPDAAVARGAALALLRAKDARALAVSERLLGDGETRVRVETVEVLAELGDKASLPMLLARLRAATDAKERQALLAALGQLGDGDTGTEILPLALDPAQDDGTRIAALAALGSLGDARVAGPLIAAYENLEQSTPRQHGRLREEILKVLGQVKAKEALPLLRSVAQANENTSLLREALRGLGAIGEPSDWEVIDAAMRKKPVIDKRGNDPVTVGFGIPALVALGDPRGIDTLLFLAFRADGHAGTPTPAIRAIARFADTKAVETLVGLLADPATHASLLTTAVAPAILDLGERAVPPLAKLLREAPPPDKAGGTDRGIFAGELLPLLGPAGTDALFALADESDSLPVHVLGRLIDALPRIEDPARVCGALARFARHADPRVRQWALVALADFPDPRAEGILRAATEDADADVRRWAAWALDPQREKSP